MKYNQQRRASRASTRGSSIGASTPMPPTPPPRVCDASGSSTAASSICSSRSDGSIASHHPILVASSCTGSVTSTPSTHDHPLQLHKGTEAIEDALSSMGQRRVETAPLSSLAFNKRTEDSQQRRHTTVCSGPAKQGARIASEPHSRRRHSTYDCPDASARISTTSTSTDTSTKWTTTTTTLMGTDLPPNMPDTQQTIIALKLELAQARSEAENQADLVEKLARENKALQDRVKFCEAEIEANQVQAASLENATYEIKDLLAENQRMSQQVDRISYERNELKNKLGLMTVSKSVQQECEQGVKLAPNKPFESTVPGRKIGDMPEKRGSGSSGNNQVLRDSGHRASAVKILSSIRTSVRCLVPDAAANQQITPDELLWIDDGNDTVRHDEGTIAA